MINPQATWNYDYTKDEISKKDPIYSDWDQPAYNIAPGVSYKYVPEKIGEYPGYSRGKTTRRK